MKDTYWFVRIYRADNAPRSFIFVADRNTPILEAAKLAKSIAVKHWPGSMVHTCECVGRIYE